MKLVKQAIIDNMTVMHMGDSDIFLDDCEIREYYFSNNDGGVKNISVLIKDKRNVTLDFGGAMLKFHGRILPFVVDGCDSVTLKNFTINYDRTFYSQADIISVDGRELVIRMDEGFPYEIRDGGLVFTSDTWENDTCDCWVLMQEFDASTKSLALDSILRIGRFGKKAKKDPLSPLPIVLFTVEDLGDRFIRLIADEDVSHYRAGYKLIMTHEQRLNPAIAITSSKNIKIENVNIAHTGAMGIIAQLTENISLQNVKIMLFEGISKGLVSTNCDGMHFVNCAGQIHVNNCVLNNMMDDGINIHGIYTRVENVSDKFVYLKIMHFQQFGINFFNTGDKVVIYQKQTVKTRGCFTVKSSELISADIIKVSFFEDFTGEEGDFADSVTMHPNVLIENTTTGFNRPRGFLLTTRGDVVVKSNTLNSCCYGIHIAGDLNYWYESTGVKNVLIENNLFRNNGVQFGDFSIAITPEYDCDDGGCFHSNIRIKNNEFYSFVKGVVYARGVDGLEITGNKFIRSTDYERKTQVEKIETINCKNAVIENNIF